MPVKEFEDAVIGEMGEVTYKGKTLIGVRAELIGEKVKFEASDLSFSFPADQTEKIAALICATSSKTDFYAYSVSEQIELVRKLAGRLLGEYQQESKQSYKITIPHTQEAAIIAFTPWRQPSNMLLSISYVVLIVEDETEPREIEGKDAKTGEPIMVPNPEKWDYYYATFCIPETVALSKQDVIGNRPAVDNLLNIFEKFVIDSRKPMEEREYKIDHQLLLRSGAQAGEWNGGFAQIPCNYVNNASIDPGKTYPDDSAT